MKSFFLKLSNREEGPYSDTQIAQMFADARVNRYTPCRKIEDKDWKTVDDYLPTLKYGTQLPPPTPKPSPPAPVPVAAYSRVALVDLDIPFLSILKMMFKWMAAAFVVFCCFLPFALAAWFLIFAAIASFFGQALSTPHQP
jgi:hypothetical protein